MADINIDTTSPQYVQLLNGLGTLRTVLAPRIQLLRQLPRDKQKAWLQRDPLLRRTIKLAQTLGEIISEELEE
jgi:hypothetical protein